MDCSLTLILGGICLILFVLHDRWKYTYYSRRGIPGPTAAPFIGTYQFMSMGFIRAMEYFDKTYGKIYGIYFLGKPSLVIHDANLLRNIMVRDFSHFTDRNVLNLKDRPMDKGLANLKGEPWKEMRNTLTPAFSATKMKKVAVIINDTCDTLVEHFEKKRSEPFIQCQELFGSFSMDVVAASFFGIKVDSQNNPDDPFVKHSKSVFNINMLNPVLLMLTIFPSSGKIFDIFNVGFFPSRVKKFFIDVTSKAVKSRNENPAYQRADVLQLMIDAHNLPAEEENQSESIENGTVSSHRDIKPKKPLGVDAIMANAITFFVAGYETTNTALCFIAYLLATNPEAQDKLIQEVDEIAPSREDVTYDIMSSMEYLDCVVHESLRLYPPASFINRVCTKEITYNGMKIENGTTITFSAYSIHHDPDYWPEPDKFIPERFSKENRGKNHPFAFLSFGGGPRICIGMRLAMMEIKFAVVRLLQKFRFETCADTQIPPVLGKTGFTSPKNGIKLTVIPRANDD